MNAWLVRVEHQRTREGLDPVTKGRRGTPGPLISTRIYHPVDASPSMTTEVFNPNPTIIVTAGPSARRRTAQARQSLWLSDDEDSTTYDSDDEPEPIDADEIFGEFLSLSLSLPYPT